MIKNLIGPLPAPEPVNVWTLEASCGEEVNVYCNGDIVAWASGHRFNVIAPRLWPKGLLPGCFVG